jgi:hypothetical protein
LSLRAPWIVEVATEPAEYNAKRGLFEPDELSSMFVFGAGSTIKTSLVPLPKFTIEPLLDESSKVVRCN